MNMDDLTVNRLLTWKPNLTESATAADNTNCMTKTNVSVMYNFIVYIIIISFSGWYSVL